LFAAVFLGVKFCSEKYVIRRSARPANSRQQHTVRLAMPAETAEKISIMVVMGDPAFKLQPEKIIFHPAWR
jgi:hypothetical protein